MSKQINGAAMGTKMGLNYTNVFVGFIEEHFFFSIWLLGTRFLWTLHQWSYWINLRSQIRTWTIRQLRQWLLSSAALNYTWEISDTCVTFLDIKLFVIDTGLMTTVHDKPTDLHSYLMYSSFTCQEFHSLFPVSEAPLSLQWWLGFWVESQWDVSAFHRSWLSQLTRGKCS